MIKVIFVCLGNICRSPMAEGLFRQKVSDMNLSDKISVESRATSTYEIGNKPHQGTQNILHKLGIKTENMTAKQITKEDFDTASYIIGMDYQNIRDLNKYKTKDNVYLLLDQNDNILKKEVPDPYYTHDFNETYELLDKALSLWLLRMISENHL